jgi:macrocin-O-methyltransferase TylF-like protien
MRARRRVANFFINGCGLRNLQGSKFQRFIRAVLDEIDLQKLRDAHSCPSFQDRVQMYRSVHESYFNGNAVDYLEFGVFRGESMREWVSLNKNKDSRFFGFDSFEGLPEDWREGQGRGHFDVQGVIPRIDDPRVKFVKGWYENTVPPFVRDFSTKNRILLHVDCDLYSSAMLALVHFAPFMSKGTLIIFDEFYDRENEYKALMDWQRISKKTFRIVAETSNYGKVCVELQ